MTYEEYFYQEHIHELKENDLIAKLYPSTGSGILLHRDLEYAIPISGCSVCCRSGEKRDILLHGYIWGYLHSRNSDKGKILEECLIACEVNKDAWR